MSAQVLEKAEIGATKLCVHLIGCVLFLAKLKKPELNSHKMCRQYKGFFNIKLAQYNRARAIAIEAAVYKAARPLPDVVCSIVCGYIARDENHSEFAKGSLGEHSGLNSDTLPLSVRLSRYCKKRIMVYVDYGYLQKLSYLIDISAWHVRSPRCRYLSELNNIGALVERICKKLPQYLFQSSLTRQLYKDILTIDITKYLSDRFAEYKKQSVLLI